MSSRSKFLLSDAAKPKVGVPRAATHHQREYRLPTCVDRAARGKGIHRAKTKILANTRNRAGTGQPCASFRDRTLTWFKLGEELEDTTAPYELADVEVTASRKRRLLIGGAAGGAFLFALALTWIITG